MKKIKYIILNVVLIFSFSCQNILEPEIKGQIELYELLSTQSGMITAVNGIYQPLHSIYSTQLNMVLELASDDGWTWTFGVDPDIFIMDETSSSLESIWTLHYRGITRANIVIDRSGLVDDFSSEVYENAIVGQAKFMRAFYYFNLVRIFGGVPLIVNEIVYREDAEQPRATIENIYAQIKQDLSDAIGLLPTSYPGGLGMEVGRPTSNAAKALKSMVHLELEEWSDAATLAEELIGTGTLLPNYANNFNGTHENSPASLFEVQYGGVTAQTTASSHHHVFSPPAFQGQATILPTDDSFEGEGGSLSSGNGFLQSFEQGDLRRNVILSNYGLPNFIDPTKPAGSLYFINKYYNTVDPRGLSRWNFPLIRYAEVLLIRAEALNEIGFIADGEAFQLLNAVRTNSGLLPVTSVNAANQSAFRNLLRNERRIELAFEVKRYFDLNRWGILESAIQKQMDYTGLQFPSNRVITHPITGNPYHLYPVPHIEFTNNARLGEQNPGY